MLKATFSFFVRSLEIMALYQYCEENYKNDIVIIHHGIIQNLISFVYINQIRSAEKFSRYSKNIICKHVCYIHIEIEVDNALIRLRKRKNQHGRLPKIKNDKKLLEALYYQNGVFYYCDEILNSLEINNKYKISNNLKELNLKDQIFEVIKKCEKSKQNTKV